MSSSLGRKRVKFSFMNASTSHPLSNVALRKLCLVNTKKVGFFSIQTGQKHFAVPTEAVGIPACTEPGFLRVCSPAWEDVKGLIKTFPVFQAFIISLRWLLASRSCR